MDPDTAQDPAPRRPLYVYNGGFLTQPRIRRILTLKGFDIRLGKPGPGDAVGVWGQSPTAPRGEAVARLTGAPVIRVEDAFLRSLFPGRTGEPTLGLLIDETGVHFDASAPSDLETLLATHPFDAAHLDRARDLIASLRRAHLSKFAATDPALPLPEPGVVLVIDQTRGDAAVTASGADAATFHAMLEAARDENPGATVIIKTHPETARGLRPGHFDDTAPELPRLTAPVSPWALFDRAAAVYTVSSGLGLEAVLAGQRPHVFGTPVYAGWGLTHDRGAALTRRGRDLPPEALAAAALLLAPAWYDPYRDRLARAEDVVRTLAAQARAWREDRAGWHMAAMSRWKRPHLRAFFGAHAPVSFAARPAADKRRMVWASAATKGDPATRIEDGFLRSRGLGAALTPPLSLVLDDLGIYYDPSRESRLERLIAESVHLPVAEIERAEALIVRIRALGLSKYNIGREIADLPPGRPRILVVGQVEDDASVRTGAGTIATNAALLAAARAAEPGATLLYKPHPDVEAGLRKGAATPPSDIPVLRDTAPHALLSAVDGVWTMTSLLGFEALLRGVPVTVTGAPFYAGWGLTRDLGEIPSRRTARPTLAGLVHAALIAYPRYHDPLTGLPCPVEVAVERLASGKTKPAGGTLARLQALRGLLRRRT